MAAITPAPFVVRDCTVQVGTDTFEQAVSSVRFRPSFSAQTFSGVSPGAVFVDIDEPTWTAELTFAQDWQTSGSLANYLFEHIGSKVVMAFEPIAGGKTASATIVCAPSEIGGDKGAFATGTVSLPSTKPVFA